MQSPRWVLPIRARGGRRSTVSQRPGFAQKMWAVRYVHPISPEGVYILQTSQGCWKGRAASQGQGGEMWGGGSRQEAVMPWALGSDPQDSSTLHAGPLSLIQDRVLLPSSSPGPGC